MGPETCAQRESEVGAISKIVRVDAMDRSTLDIQLANGSILLFNLALLGDDPRFLALAEDDRILYPKTDGKAIYWRDGPRLGMAEILRLLQENEGDEREGESR